MPGSELRLPQSLERLGIGRPELQRHAGQPLDFVRLAALDQQARQGYERPCIARVEPEGLPERGLGIGPVVGFKIGTDQFAPSLV